MSASEFKYLKTILELKEQNNRVIMADIAQKLTYARASVYNKLISLEEHGLIVKGKDKSIVLTEKGKREFDSINKLVEICCEILSKYSNLEKRTLWHDAVAMACCLSSKCKKSIMQNI